MSVHAFQPTPNAGGVAYSGKTREGISQVKGVHWRHGGGQCATVCPHRDIMFIVVTDDTQKPFDSSIFSPWHIDCVFILCFMETSI